MTSIPIRFPTQMGSLLAREGMLEEGGDGLVLSVQTRENVFKLLRLPVRKIKIPVEQIEEISIGSTFTGMSLKLRLKDLRLLSKIPGSSDGIANLKISRRYRGEVEALESSISLAIADAKMQATADLLSKS